MLNRACGLLVLWLVPVMSGWSPAQHPRDAAPETRRAESAPTTAITNVTVVDVEAGRNVAAQTVLIVGDAIAKVGPTAGTKPPDDATIIDGTGRFLIPGLFDCHVHFIDPLGQGPMSVANGVTFVRDMGGGTAFCLANRQRFRSGEVTGPDMIVCGAILDGPNPIWPTSERCPTPEAGRAAVRKLAEAGVDQIKVYVGLPRFAYLAIVDEAKQLDLAAVGHVPDAVRVGEALSVGQASIEHLSGFDRVVARFAGGNPDSAPTFIQAARYWDLFPQVDLAQLREFLKEVKDAGCVQCPTLSVIEGIAATFDPEAAKNPLVAYVPLPLRANWKPDPYGLGKSLRTALPHMKKMVREMHAAGVPLVCGTDLANPYVFAGFSLHREMELFQEAGIPPSAVLRAATFEAADLCGMADRLGVIAAGKTASLVLLRKDPLLDVKNTAEIDGVMSRGRWFDRAALDALLTAAREHAASFSVATRPDPAKPR